VHPVTDHPSVTLHQILPGISDYLLAHDVDSGYPIDLSLQFFNKQRYIPIVLVFTSEQLNRSIHRIESELFVWPPWPPSWRSHC
ncbi:hypothetical protein PENTCL1PPCAC_12340, partial [Pristionchus entomophagus]